MDRAALGSLATNPQLDRWVGFADDGRLLISTGKVELGQGIRIAVR